VTQSNNDIKPGSVSDISVCNFS